MVETEEEEEVSQETVTFLYKLSEGACPKSYGFNAARLAGVPSVITKRAHEIAGRIELETNQKHVFSALCRANTAAKMRDLFVMLNKFSCAHVWIVDSDTLDLWAASSIIRRLAIYLRSEYRNRGIAHTQNSQTRAYYLHVSRFPFHKT